jgi:UDP-GlcNAc:undecaprenyl-phosphate GlcNAc-1-phosphate transferase
MLAASLLVYYFGSYLGTVPIYASDEKSLEEARSRNLFILDTFVAYKRIVVDVSVDLLVVLASYLAAFLLRFEGVLSPLNQQLVVRSLGLLLALRLVSFFAFGLYRHVHGSFTMHDFLAILKAVVASSAAFVTLLVLLYRFRDYSRAVIVIDMVLTLSGITFARIAVRSFQELFGGLSRPGERRTLIVGAGSLGDGVARLIKADGQRTYRIVGFLDDSPAKLGRNLAGHRVVGRTSDAEEVIRRLRVDEVILACSTLDHARKEEIRRICDALGLQTREAGLF